MGDADGNCPSQDEPQGSIPEEPDEPGPRRLCPAEADVNRRIPDLT